MLVSDKKRRGKKLAVPWNLIHTQCRWKCASLSNEENPLVLTCHPLHPDDVVLVFRRGELLQVEAVVGLDAVGVVAKVLFVCVEEEVLHHVRQLHLLKHRKEDAFGHAADPAATVQGTVRAGFTGTLWMQKKLMNQSCSSREHYLEVCLRESQYKFVRQP